MCSMKNLGGGGEQKTEITHYATKMKSNSRMSVFYEDACDDNIVCSSVPAFAQATSTFLSANLGE